MTARQILIENDREEVMIFDGPCYDMDDESDTALIGISDEDRAIYSYDKMIDILIANSNGEMDYDEAVEFIDYNEIRSLPHFQKDKGPIVLYKLEEC